MTGPSAAHLTTAVAVVGGGMLVGHVLAPYAPGADALRRVAFALAILALGAWRGAAEWRAHTSWNERPVASGAVARSAACGAIGALLVAAAAYGIAHG